MPIPIVLFGFPQYRVSTKLPWRTACAVAGPMAAACRQQARASSPLAFAMSPEYLDAAGGGEDELVRPRLHGVSDWRSSAA